MLMELLVVKRIIQLENTYLVVRVQYPEGEKFVQLHVHVVRGVRK
jgi:hypothetical protein